MGGALARQVTGYSVRSNGSIYVPLVVADRPGNSDVGRFLDSLPIEHPIVVPAVFNARLAGMLDRRGFRQGWEWADAYEEWCPAYYRESVWEGAL